MSDSISPSEARTRSLDRLSAGPFDVLVVGGGIVGSGIARDLAMRGLTTALVEQSDFASGTSSRSSRLLHGGLRYLAQGRIRLVREASTEKMTLFRIAPHLAMPLPFLLPTYRGNRDWQRWKLRIGVKLYDWLCGKGNLGNSSAFDPSGLKAVLPGINADGLTGGVRYFDALTSDARLVIDTLRSATTQGATVANYAKVVTANPDGDVWRCEVIDQASGRTLAVTARAVVNAAGPWGDRLPASGVKLRLSKGVHLVIDRSRLPVPDAVVMTDGKRILFAIPWGERVILGTTDTDYAGDLGSPPVEREDVDYILKIVNRSFPHASIFTGDVISTWTGIRPLVADPSGAPSDVSREHEIHMPSPGWFDVAGGKLTTYRLMAEQTVDQIVKHLGTNAGTCQTANEPVVPAAEAAFSGVVPPAVSRDAVEQFCRKEWAVRLEDVMIRRSSWQHYHADSDAIARTVLDWMTEFLGWSDAEAAAEWERYAGVAKALKHY